MMIGIRCRLCPLCIVSLAHPAVFWFSLLCRVDNAPRYLPGGQCTQVFAGWTMHPGNWHAERHIGKIATSRSRCEIFAVCSQLWIWACFQHLLAWGIFRLSFVDALWPLVQRDDASQKVHHTPPDSHVWLYLVTTFGSVWSFLSL